MPEATLSSKYQVTLPMDVVRALGLKGGEKLVVTLVEDHVVLMPKPANWAAWAKGRTRGFYGTTPEEVDRYVAELRGKATPQEAEKQERLEDLLAQDQGACCVLHFLRKQGSALYSELYAQRERLSQLKLDPLLECLEGLGAIKALKGADTQYRLTQLGREMSKSYRPKQAW